MGKLITELVLIEKLAAEKEEESDKFRQFVKNADNKYIDDEVHSVNRTITAEIDCTQCGRVCQILMINITEPEVNRLAGHLNLSAKDTKATYIEQSEQGQMIMNTIPCAFLKDKKCSIYEHRFTECRDFPHLHKSGFINRLFATLMYYGMCPIIYNVVENLKKTTGFIPDKKIF